MQNDTALYFKIKVCFDPTHGFKGTTRWDIEHNSPFPVEPVKKKNFFCSRNSSSISTAKRQIEVHLRNTQKKQSF